MSNLGSWDIIGTSGAVCIHTFYLPLNRMVCVERPHEAPYPPNSNTNGNPATEVRLTNDAGAWDTKWQSVPVVSNAFCGGHSQLSDGSILMVGGDPRSDTGLQDGLKKVRKYTPCNTTDCAAGSFAELYEMTTERWYPTVVTLKDGNAIIISGTKNNLDFNDLSRPIQNPTYEYYPAKTEGQWPRTLSILEWAFPFVLYPMAFQLPSGNLFLFVSNKSIILDPKTDQIYYKIPDLLTPNHWPFIYPSSPHMLMLPLTKANNYKATFLLCGGSQSGNAGEIFSSKKCFKITPEDSSPAWVQEDDMPVQRVMLDGVLLPDGKVLYVNGAGWGLAGGSQGGDTSAAGDPVFETCLYDPQAPSGAKWSLLPKSQVPRLYHSGAILTAEGYVVTTGSEMQNYIDKDPNCFPKGKNVCTSPYEYRIERYTPYYLVTGKPRPVIKTAPSDITFSSTFLIEIRPGVNINRATFIRYSTTTHYTNTDQRFIELEIIGVGSDGKVGIKVPSDGAIAPPGNWMLFVLSDGVPSVAKTILLHDGPQTFISDEDLKNLKPLSGAGIRTSGSYSAWTIIALILAVIWL